MRSAIALRSGASLENREAARLDRTTSDCRPESDAVMASDRLNAKKSVSGSGRSTRNGKTISRVMGGERFALQVLHDEEIKAVLPADVVEGADVRMVQTRSRPGLALESLSQVGIVGHMAGENFDRDGSVEPRVRGSIHFPHPTGTEVGMDFVRAEPRSGIE